MDSKPDGSSSVEKAVGHSHEPEAAHEEARQSSWLRGESELFARRYGLVGAWVVVVVVFSVANTSTYFTFSNAATILSTQAILLMVALALLVPLVVGEFDLSVAGSLGLSFVLCPYLLVNHHVSLVWVIAICLVSGAVIGLINGLITVGLGVASIVVTLGTGTILYGIGYALLSGPVGGIDNGLTSFMEANAGGVEVPFFIALGFTLALTYVFNFRAIGKTLYFTGMNHDATRLSGARINRIRLLSFVVSALIASFAGIALAGLDGGGDPSTAQSYLLPVFASVFLSGTVITPGRVNPLGTFIAVYFLASGVTGLEIRGLTGWVEQVFYGGALVVGVAIARVKTL